MFNIGARASTSREEKLSENSEHPLLSVVAVKDFDLALTVRQSPIPTS
jgi:hypothetical protein